MALGCQNNISLGMSVPEGIERYLFPVHFGLYWVPGHAGIAGNEITDTLTRDASDQGMLDLSKDCWT